MIDETVKLKGRISMFRLAGNLTAKSPYVAKLREYVRTKKAEILNELKEAGILKEVTEKENIIVTVGRAVLARRLAGDVTYTGEINYGALGTAVAPVPVNGSTTLGTEVFRKIASSQAYSDNICYVDFFYSATDCNGTYTEFGNFIDGAAGVDTGQLFSYIATGGWVKSAIESLFVSCQYTIT